MGQCEGRIQCLEGAEEPGSGWGWRHGQEGSLQAPRLPRHLGRPESKGDVEGLGNRMAQEGVRMNHSQWAEDRGLCGYTVVLSYDTGKAPDVFNEASSCSDACSQR